MLDAQVRLPVLLECVHADLPIVGHIRVKDLGEEEALGWTAGEVLAQHQLDSKVTIGVGGPSWEQTGKIEMMCEELVKFALVSFTWAINDGLNVREVLLIQDDLDAFRGVTDEVMELLADLAAHLGCQVLKGYL